MRDDALVSAYPGKRMELDFERGIFSPDGMLFAVTLSNIRTGSPEQVWIYDLRSKRAVPVMQPPPEEPGKSRSIREMVWSDDSTLYVSAQRINVTAHPYFVAARLENSTEVESLPATIADVFRQQKTPSSFPDLPREEHNDRYSVVARNQGHGDIVLEANMQKGGTPRQIARASWELESFFFSKDRSEVLYPTVDAIMAFSLRTGKYRAVLPRTGRFLRLLGCTRDGKLIAYTVSGPCVRNPEDRSPVHRPRNVCFFRAE